MCYNIVAGTKWSLVQSICAAKTVCIACICDRLLVTTNWGFFIPGCVCAEFGTSQRGGSQVGIDLAF